jgi:hypothetical protein
MSSLQFGNTPVAQGSFIPLSVAQEEPHIAFRADPNSLYTIVFYDITAPYPSNPYRSPYLHYLVVDIPGGRISEGRPLIDYEAPNPPKDSAAHTYYLDVYRQNGKSSAQKHTRRQNFDLQGFIERHNLVIPALSSFFFQTGYNEPTSVPTTVAAAAASYFIVGNPLNEREQAFCKCVLDVASKQPGQCNLEKAWFEERDNQTCYNPMAVCAASVGTSSRKCDLYYDYNNLPDADLIAWANLKAVPVPVPYDRDVLLERIGERIQQRFDEKYYQ